MDSENSHGRKQRKKLIVIIVIAGLILVGGGILLFVLLSGGSNDPEKIAQRILDASFEKDWKAVIDLTQDEALEMLLDIRKEKAKEMGISTVKEFRDWATAHVAEISDSMNGKEIRNHRIGDVKTMSPEYYIKYYLGGDGEDAYSSFLRSKEEIAVADVYYTSFDGSTEVERYDSILLYRKNGKWYPLTGLQIINSMLDDH